MPAEEIRMLKGATGFGTTSFSLAVKKERPSACRSTLTPRAGYKTGNKMISTYLQEIEVMKRIEMRQSNGIVSPKSSSTNCDFDAARQAGKKAEALLRQMAGLVSGEKT
jgi:hypothetical protein